MDWQNRIIASDIPEGNREAVAAINSVILPQKTTSKNDKTQDNSDNDSVSSEYSLLERISIIVSIAFKNRDLSKNDAWYELADILSTLERVLPSLEQHLVLPNQINNRNLLMPSGLDESTLAGLTKELENYFEEVRGDTKSKLGLKAESQFDELIAKLKNIDELTQEVAMSNREEDYRPHNPKESKHSQDFRGKPR